LVQSNHPIGLCLALLSGTEAVVGGKNQRIIDPTNIIRTTIATKTTTTISGKPTKPLVKQYAPKNNIIYQKLRLYDGIKVLNGTNQSGAAGRFLKTHTHNRYRV